MEETNLKKRVSQIERDLKDINEKIETLTAWKGIYVHYSYAKDTPDEIKTTVISYLDKQEELDRIRKIKEFPFIGWSTRHDYRHGGDFEVRPAFLQTVIDDLSSYNMKTEILLTPASLSDIQSFSRKLKQLIRRVIDLEELENYVHDSVETINEMFNKLEEKLKKLEDAIAEGEGRI